MGSGADALGRVGKRFRTLPGEGVQHSTALLRDGLQQSLRRDAGGDRRLSGLGRSGRAQTVKVTKSEHGSFVEGRVMAGPRDQRAPWFWMEEGTAAGARRVRGTSRRYRGGLTTYYHPGTPAKRTWSEPVGRIAPSIEQHFVKLVERAMRG